MYSRGRGSYRGRRRGRGVSSWQRSRGRGRGFNSSIVDNRPKKLLVTGFDTAEKEDVISHFASFSQMDRIEETTPDKLILTFPTRQSAEVAASSGVSFNGKQLLLAWFVGQGKVHEEAVQPQQHQRTTRSMSQNLSEKDLDEELLELDKEEEEMLLAGVEDDDDEDMERSWKR